jgi:hypothetical protein
MAVPLKGSRMAGRVQRELQMLDREPPFGIQCWSTEEDQVSQLMAGNDILVGVFRVAGDLSDAIPLVHLL